MARLNLAALEREEERHTPPLPIPSFEAKKLTPDQFVELDVVARCAYQGYLEGNPHKYITRSGLTKSGESEFGGLF